MTSLCACNSQKLFDVCCGRFLSGNEKAKTPEQLMRSRYSAYALGNHGEYLLRTWFPATARGLTAETLSQRNCDWLGLEIVDKEQTGDQGMVEFKAGFRDESGVRQVMHEKSVFQRIGGSWLYVGGEVSSTEETLPPQ
jgi:SEC-C motif-containing protein